MGDEYIKRKDVLIKLEIAYDMARVDQKLPISDLQHEVNLIKAADVQPIKHGLWLYSDRYITCAYEDRHYSTCSICGEDSLDEGEYCSYCGARMDGEKNED